MRRVALVTGAGRGIGRAIAARLAADGLAVAVNDIDEAAAQRVVAAIRDGGGEALAVPGDVTRADEVGAMVATTTAALGPPDVLVNNAGVISVAPVAQLEEAQWSRVLAVNLTGAFLCAKAVVSGMVDRGWGRIVSIASDAAKTGEPYLAHYCASKFGLVGLTQSLALEVAGAGVTVNAVCPAITATEMMERLVDDYARIPGVGSESAARAAFVAEIPMGRVGRPEDVAGVVAFLCGEDAAFVSGQALNVSGAHEVH
ncbi:MAG: SDR family oxidoreductase [Solirubrobacteraceae bacterium]|nr:SDR family oxidoreductase [Solirubrobacteraceae bacterium]